MKIGFKGLNLIKEFEGFESQAYYCPAGIPTIGWGHTKDVTDDDVKYKRTITMVEAEKLLIEDLDWAEDAVNKLVKVKITQNQFDALTSLVFNIGEPNFRKSTVLRKLNEGNYEKAREAFKMWVKAGDEVLPGLINRREAEMKLFSETQSAGQK